MRKGKKIISGIIFFTILLTIMIAWHQASAQVKFPSKPVTVIVSWAPGGADVNLRALQPHAEKVLGQPIIIINKPGGAGTIGFMEGANAQADGYTVTLVTPSIVVTPYTVTAKPDYKSFDPVILTAEIPTVVAVKIDAPWKTFNEFMEYAKANPGKVRMSNSGHAAMYHIGAVGIEAATGMKFTHVPHKGSAPAIMALVGGHVEGVLTSYTTLSQMVAGGKLKVLAVAGGRRYYPIPDVPTFKELGIDLELSTWYGYLVPKGTPKDRIKVIHDAFKKAIETSDYKAKTKELGAEIHYLDSDEFGKYLEKQDKQWLRLIEYGGFRTVK